MADRTFPIFSYDLSLLTFAVPPTISTNPRHTGFSPLTVAALDGYLKAALALVITLRPRGQSLAGKVETSTSYTATSHLLFPIIATGRRWREVRRRLLASTRQ
jgi:hypothetical protein